MQQITIRLCDKIVSNAVNFAEVHKMSRAAAVEFFVEFGINAYLKTDQDLSGESSLVEEISELKLLLAQTQSANYRALVYLIKSVKSDAARFDFASAAADKNVREIFGEEMLKLIKKDTSND